MDHFEIFKQLHYQPKPFILANVWNAKSARIVENSGFRAMATSSGAIAESLGYPDGEILPFAELFYIVQRIRKCTNLPLSVDLERGYTDSPELLNEHVQKLIDAGVVGINLEDNQGEDIYLNKLSSIKNYLIKTNQSFFINARTDGFLQKIDSPLATTLRRAKKYAEEGADGLFVTAVPDMSTLKTITAASPLPVNVAGNPKSNNIEELAGCGVKRISMAPFLFKATYARAEAIAREIVERNTLESLFAN